MISSSSPLIYLSKINKLILLKNIFGEITITDAVKSEILFGDRKDSFAVMNAIEEGWIKIKNPRKYLDFNIDKAENSVINLAIEKKDSLIIDDAKGIRIAESLGISVVRTTSIIFNSIKKKLLTKKEAIELLKKLIEEGYYLSPRVYSVIIEKLMEK